MGVFPTVASGLMGSKSRSNRLAPSWKGPGASNLAAVRKKSSMSIRHAHTHTQSRRRVRDIQELRLQAQKTWWYCSVPIITGSSHGCYWKPSLSLFHRTHSPSTRPNELTWYKHLDLLSSKGSLPLMTQNGFSSILYLFPIAHPAAFVRKAQDRLSQPHTEQPPSL